ncbi:MAG TPA: Gfo/Idh/MocA family oxidoreductase [bacterium]|nr:Gfo/Idh/MocA family oxidoreductase [bacterium]
MSKEKKSRRDFLKGSAMAAGVGMASLHGITPASVLGANDKVRCGVIGVGDRGTWGLRELIKHEAQVVAVCDVYEARLMRARDLTEDDAGRKADVYYEHERLLERGDIDAVYIAVPDHWHHDILIDTVKAGKDAYIEKPFSKTIEEGRNMVKAVRETNRVVQVGNHRRSGEHWLRAREWIRSGKLGHIAWVKVYDTRDWSKGDPWAAQIASGIQGRLDWNRFLGKAPKRPFDPHRYFTWRWYWDYAGGLITDIGAHELDINQWLMDQEGPQSVMCHGGNHVFPTWETPDVVHAILNYGSFTTLFTVQFVSGVDGNGEIFYGTDGTLVADATRNVIRVYMPQGATEPVEEWAQPYEGPAHVANFLECVKSRKEPNSPVETANNVITAAHLANLSYRTGQRVQWDPKTGEMLEIRRVTPSDAWLRSRL